MEIGEIEKVRHIELPKRVTAPAKPERKPFRRKTNPEPKRAPVKTPEKAPAKSEIIAECQAVLNGPRSGYAVDEGYVAWAQRSAGVMARA